ncbi:uncharacterized protein LOC118752762 [Rhagoletis pomonella]|uniref:uncharacterized protein LOC118752762 n=1 Tax=Rhagoletis pomonella TaxID=28610 RepID=UPI00177E198A|nr:uncharacterized protein LOC118752762 [Rhagoletis pomonella]
MQDSREDIYARSQPSHTTRVGENDESATAIRTAIARSFQEAGADESRGDTADAKSSGTGEGVDAAAMDVDGEGVDGANGGDGDGATTDWLDSFSIVSWEHMQIFWKTK